jgi:hypothetical protein
MERTLLKAQHAYAVRTENRAEIDRTEKELAKHGVIADWLTDDVMVWREGGDKKKPRKVAAPSGDYYPDSACTVCSAPVEKTGKPGRRPAKCLQHR